MRASFFQLNFVFCFFYLTACFPQHNFYKTYGHVTEGGEGRNIIQAADGGYFLSYYIYFAGKAIACITKLDCTGEKEWEQFFSRDFNTLPVDIIPTADLGCLVSLSSNAQGGIWRHYVVRLDKSGNQLWSRGIKMHVGNPTSCMARDKDGSIFICGGVDIAITGKNGVAIAKLDEEGNIYWIRHFYDDHFQVPRCMTINSEGNVAVAGTISYGPLPFSDAFVLLCDNEGMFIKRKIISTHYDDELLGICADKQGNIFLTGYSYFINSAWDVFFHRLDRNLNLSLSRFYDSGTTQGEQARHITIGRDGKIAVFGDEGGFNERNPMVLKLEEDGSIIWSKSFPVSPFFTNYLFYGSVADDGGFLMTGDFRPLSQFRIAPVIKAAPDGEVGCFTNNLPLAARFDSVVFTDTVLQSSLVVDLIDTTFFPGTIHQLLTGITTYCSNEKPCGNFSVMNDTLCPRACYTFTDHSREADSWLWTFENGIPSFSNDQFPPEVCFSGPGYAKVTLHLTNSEGTSTYTQYVNAVADCPFLIPDIFTPNNDGLNDIFYASGLYEGFSLRIFNRWGREIFYAGFPGNWWDGSSNNGTPASEGVYFYIIQTGTGNKAYHGKVELIR